MVRSKQEAANQGKRHCGCERRLGGEAPRAAMTPRFLFSMLSSAPKVDSKGQTGTERKMHEAPESNWTELSASLLCRTSSSRARGVSHDAGNPCGHSVTQDRI